MQLERATGNGGLFFDMRTIAPFLLVFVSACATAPTNAPAPCHAGLAIVNSSLWIQSAAEYKASATQVYNTARKLLDARLAESSDKPAAIILDLDETAIENMAFEARMVHAGKTFNQAEWLQWVNESAARAVPGAAEFLAYARSRGVTPFYITNRKAEEEAGTRANLQRLGYPLDAPEDTLLVRGERTEWQPSDKSPRREYVASRYRVLLVFGDDLNDFVNAQGLDGQQRDARVRENAQRWGTDWLILPNPVYGSWERAITGNATECEALQKKVDALRP